MKNLALVVLFVLLTALSWGSYGPVLDEGQSAMAQTVDDHVERSRLRPFVCVGLAYFLIAVLVPGALLYWQSERGHWSLRGIVWSLAAGAAGALGALGIIVAFTFRGNPIYVMPLVFGGAPVVNTIYSMWTGRTYKQAGPLFFAGLILVVTGAVTVLIFRPAHHAGPAGTLPAAALAVVLLSVLLTAVSWGVYGPVLHHGQMAMAGSRLRPLICVGLAYFLIAVLIPAAVLSLWQEPGQWTVRGTLWSLGGGAAGAVGALGIIMAFNFGGKPIYVMPLVFGGAPVVNTFISMLAKGTSGEISPVFYAGLIVVAVGAVTVLLFAPKGHPPQPAAAPPQGKVEAVKGRA